MRAQVLQLETIISALPGGMVMPSTQSGTRNELVSLEMSGATASVILAQGSINVWFGRNIDRVLVQKILIIISKVDSTTEHEKELMCRFEEISEFESNGYILTSYSRKGERYRAIFVVPFSNQRAMDRFADSISDELGHEDVSITLYWRGGRARMNILREELERLKCFDFVNAVRREDQIKNYQ
jgi:hypothetical protein